VYASIVSFDDSLTSSTTATLGMSGWFDLTQLGLAPNQKHQAFLGAPKIVHCGEKIDEQAIRKGGLSFVAKIGHCGERDVDGSIQPKHHAPRE
jgi:hypothetical protein